MTTLQDVRRHIAADRRAAPVVIRGYALALALQRRISRVSWRARVKAWHDDGTIWLAIVCVLLAILLAGAMMGS